MSLTESETALMRTVAQLRAEVSQLNAVVDVFKLSEVRLERELSVLRKEADKTLVALQMSAREVAVLREELQRERNKFRAIAEREALECRPTGGQPINTTYPHTEDAQPQPVVENDGKVIDSRGTIPV